MERKRLYKSASETVNALRARRREQQSGVWKEKREKILSFKRFRFEDKEDSSELNDLTVEEVAVIGKSVQKHGPNILKDLQRLRKAFTQGSEFGDAFITQLDGALEALVRYLTGNDAELQIEAAWCLTNLAGATQQHASRILKATGAYLITYLKGQNVQLVDLCAWTLGNLAGDSEECRRMLRDQGAVDPLLNLLKVKHLVFGTVMGEINPSNHFFWLCSNFYVLFVTVYKPSPRWEPTTYGFICASFFKGTSALHSK